MSKDESLYVRSQMHNLVQRILVVLSKSFNRFTVKMVNNHSIQSLDDPNTLPGEISTGRSILALPFPPSLPPLPCPVVQKSQFCSLVSSTFSPRRPLRNLPRLSGSLYLSGKKAKKLAKNAKSSSTVHPPYSEMRSNAILILEDQGGSSQPAVSKPIGKSLPSGLDGSLSVRVKKLVESERLVKAKSSYKVASPTENPGLPGKEAPKEQRAARKTRRLSQVETLEALKKATRKRKAMATEVGGRNGGKVKTPEGFENGEKKKTKKTAAMPVKRKSLKRGSSSRPAKKGTK